MDRARAGNAGLLALLLTGTLAVGCAGGQPAGSPPESRADRGADGDREVSEGPGLFTGEEGGIEFDLLEVLRRRTKARAQEGEPEGPE